MKEALVTTWDNYQTVVFDQIKLAEIICVVGVLLLARANKFSSFRPFK